jgi:hypothetical protein
MLMNKIQQVICVMIVLNLICVKTTCYGQHNIRIGITGGPSAAQIKTSTNLTNLIWKYNAGIAFTGTVIGNLSLAVELVYSRQGSRLALNQNQTYTTHFDYIALPVLARFKPNGKQLFIQTGGKLGYLVNSSDKYTNSNSPSDLSNLRKWDAGAMGGVGTWLGKHTVIDFRYYHGMAGLIKKHAIVDPITGKTFFGADKWNHRVWSVNLTYYF